MDINRRILVLDDEEGVLDAYRVVFEPIKIPISISSSRTSVAFKEEEANEKDFFPEYYKTPSEALIAIEKALKEKRPFVGGFIDVKLKGEIDGIEFIRRVKEIDSEFLVVMVTAYEDRSIDEIAAIFGKDYADRWDFLLKPFTRNEILQKARNMIANWERKRKEKAYLEKIKAQSEALIQQQALAAVGNLARGIGHEFGNILLGIIGKAELARQKGTIEAMDEALKFISATAERAGVITRNLQTLVRTDTKHEPTYLPDLVKECVMLLEHELKKSAISVVERYSGSIPIIEVNRTGISQVLLNLTINAIHAMKDKKAATLTYRMYVKDNSLIIEVEDTGTGIDEKIIDKIFMALFTTKGSGGSGIGLAVSKKIIRAHGGKLTVHSVLGKGSVFKISLPLKKY